MSSASERSVGSEVGGHVVVPDPVGRRSGAGSDPVGRRSGAGSVGRDRRVSDLFVTTPSLVPLRPSVTDDTSGDMQPVQTDHERRFRTQLLTVVAVAAIWRFGVLVVDKWHQPLLLNDSLYYSAQATQLANGVWFREIFVDRPGAEHGPLTSTLLAAVSWVDDPVPWQRSVTVLCGICTVGLLGLLGRRFAGPRVGIVAATIAAVYPNLWMNDGLVMSESVSILMVCLTLWMAHWCLSAPTSRRAAAVGVVAGLAALARSELALLSPAIGVLVAVTIWRAPLPAAEHPGIEPVEDARDPEPLGVRLVRAGRPMIALGATALLTVAPWVTFNMARFEMPVTLTTNDGTTLLGSYCVHSFQGPNLGGWSIFCITDDPAYSMDEEPSVRSARQRDLAVQFARDHVGDLPKVVAARIARTLDLYGLDSLVQQDVGEERYRWASWAGIASWWVLAPLAVVGGVRLSRRTAPRRWPLWLLLCPVASVTLITVVFYGAHRIRSSMEPTVVLLAAIALVWLWDRRRPVEPMSQEPMSQEPMSQEPMSQEVR